MLKSRKYIFLITFALAVFIGVSFYMCSADEEIRQTGSLFSDLNETDWFYADVKYANEKGLMTGMGDGVFSPYEKTTRGMIVTILWRLDGAEKEEGNSFSDVSADSYYYDAVAWASNHRIVTGYDETTFGAEDAATREQMISILYRYADHKKYDVTQKAPLEQYEDKGQISDYALEAMEWSYANGLISGTSDTALSPKDYVQRCQVAAILRRFCDVYTNSSDGGSSAEKDGAAQTEAPSENASSAVEGKSAHSGGGSGSSGGASGAVSNEKESPTAKPAERSTETDKDNDSETDALRTDSLPGISITDTEARAGEDVSVNAVITNNPGILGMTLIAYYDDERCTLESVECGDAFKDILDFTPSKTLGSGAKFVWSGVDLSEDQIKDGTALIMTFHIADNVPECKIPITLKCYDDDAVDNELNPVVLQAESGSITVRSN